MNLTGSAVVYEKESEQINTNRKNMASKKAKRNSKIALIKKVAALALTLVTIFAASATPAGVKMTPYNAEKWGVPVTFRMTVPRIALCGKYQTKRPGPWRGIQCYHRNFIFGGLSRKGTYTREKVVKSVFQELRLKSSQWTKIDAGSNSQGWS